MRVSVEEDSPLWAFVLGKDTKKNLRSYPWQKQVLKKVQKEHLKGEVGQVKRGTGPRLMRYRFFKTGLFIFI